MELVLYSIILTLCLIYGFKAFRLYIGYPYSIYNALYSSFGEYFYRVIIRKDASKSSALARAIGYHRIIYTTLRDKENKLKAQFIIIFYSHGIALINFMDGTGSISGNTKEKRLSFKSGSVKSSLKNPLFESDIYIKRLKRLYPEIPVKFYFAVSNTIDYSNLKSDYVICNYTDIVKSLTSDSAYFMNENQIDQEFKKLHISK